MNGRTEFRMIEHIMGGRGRKKKPAHPMIHAVLKGREAFYAGDPESANPYRENAGDGNWNAWLDGWRAAKADSQGGRGLGPDELIKE